MYALLHIGKTGGTYTQQVIAEAAEASGAILCLPHRYSLAMALAEWPERSVVFGLRSPDRIFVSGFYSRMRQGQPRHDLPWSPAERDAFSVFITPNQLAEALSAECLDTRSAAESAMSSIMHVKNGLRAYLESAAFVRSAASRIAFILRQEALDGDLRQFLSRLIPGGFDPPPVDEIARHANPAQLDTHLSEHASINIARWYRVDFQIYRECLEMAAALRDRWSLA
jgi:hypothetical protein